MSAHGLVRGVIGCGARGVLAPELLVRPDEIGPQDAHGPYRASGPVLAHFEIEFERPRRDRLKLRLLGAEHAIGRPDQKADDQHEKKGQLPDDAADHVAGLAPSCSAPAGRAEATRPHEAARGDQAADDERDRERTHFRQSRLPRTRFRDMSAQAPSSEQARERPWQRTRPERANGAELRPITNGGRPCRSCRPS